MNISKTSIIKILVLLFVVSVHLRLSIFYSGVILVPFYLSILTALVLFIIQRNDLLWLPRFLLRLTVILIMLILVNFLIVSDSLSFGAFKSSAQLVLSMALAAILVISIENVPPGEMARATFKVWLVFIAFAAIEILALKETFDQLSEALYALHGRGIYSSTDRDFSLYGRVRPKVFASEPSYLATTLSILIVLCYTALKRAKYKKAELVLAVMSLVTYAVSPSMIILLFLLALFVWRIWPRRRSSKRRLILLAVCTFALAGPLVIAFLPSAADLSGLLGQFSETGSFFGRITVGPFVTFDLLQIYPVFGVGIGNEVLAYPTIYNRWASSGAFDMFPWYDDVALRATDLMSSGFWWQWVFLGLVGTPLFLWATLRFLRKAGVESPFRALVCAWVIWYAGSAFVDPVSWFIVAIFSTTAGVIATRRKSNG